VPVADTSQLISGVAERYASSLFDLAKEAGEVDSVTRELDAFKAMIAESTDLKRLVMSPVFSAEDQARAIGAIVDQGRIGGIAGNFLKVVAANRRLFALPGIIRSFRQLAAADRGEVAAEVTSAYSLDEAQQRELAAALKDVTGKTVSLNIHVDPSILGGLIVKVGSRQIDTSLRTKLSSLKLALKEVG
jgi:F-type H+-transporting ATPase subunit delta